MVSKPSSYFGELVILTQNCWTEILEQRYTKLSHSSIYFRQSDKWKCVIGLAHTKVHRRGCKYYSLLGKFYVCLTAYCEELRGHTPLRRLYLFSLPCHHCACVLFKLYCNRIKANFAFFDEFILQRHDKHGGHFQHGEFNAILRERYSGAFAARINLVKDGVPKWNKSALREI